MADHDTSDLQERDVNVGPAFVPNLRAAELVQPTDRPLHHPAEDAQAAAMFGVPLGDGRLDAPLEQLFPGWFRVIGSVAEDFVGASHRVPDLPDWPQRRNHVVGILGLVAPDAPFVVEPASVIAKYLAPPAPAPEAWRIGN